MRSLWERLWNAWRGQGRRLDANASENAKVAHEVAELEKQRETGLEPGRSNTDWTYVPPA